MTTTTQEFAAKWQRKRKAYARAVCLARGDWTQADLGDALEVHVNTVRNIERSGRASPAVGERIFELLKVKPLPRKADRK